MNNIYISYITERLNSLNSLEYILIFFLVFFILTIILSFIFNALIINLKKNEVNKLIKLEKLLINLKVSFENGQINADEYKQRIINLNNKYHSNNGR